MCCCTRGWKMSPSAWALRSQSGKGALWQCSSRPCTLLQAFLDLDREAGSRLTIGQWALELLSQEDSFLYFISASFWHGATLHTSDLDPFNTCSNCSRQLGANSLVHTLLPLSMDCVKPHQLSLEPPWLSLYPSLYTPATSHSHKLFTPAPCT